MKKPAAKAKAKAAPVPMEYDGDMLYSNIWFKIGLTKAEAPMLKTIGRRIFDKPVNSACVLRTLLLSALAHYDKLEPMMFRDVAYSQAEGFFENRDVFARRHHRPAREDRGADKKGEKVSTAEAIVWLEAAIAHERAVAASCPGRLASRCQLLPPQRSQGHSHSSACKRCRDQVSRPAKLTSKNLRQHHWRRRTTTPKIWAMKITMNELQNWNDPSGG